MFKKDDYPLYIPSTITAIVIGIGTIKLFNGFNVSAFLSSIFWGVVLSAIALVICLKIKSKKDEEAAMHAAREKAKSSMNCSPTYKPNEHQPIKNEEVKNKILVDDILEDYTVVDLETTGLNPQYDEIIEISAVRVRNKRIVAEYTSLVNPHKELDFFIQNLTGISNEMVNSARDISQVMPEFLDFIGSDVLIGHNIISFDLAFIKKYSRINNTCLDTLWAARQVLNNSKGNKLEELCNKFGIKQDNAHRALSDCVSTHLVYQKLCDNNLKKKNYFTIEIATAGKEYQKNIIENCKLDAELDFYLDDQTNRYILTCSGKPIGYAKVDARKLFEMNANIIKNIYITDISENDKGRKLITAEAKLSGIIKT